MKKIKRNQSNIKKLKRAVFSAILEFSINNRTKIIKLFRKLMWKIEESPRKLTQNLFVDMPFISIQMKFYTKEIGKIRRKKGKDNLQIIKEQCTKVNGKTTKKTELELKCFQVEISTLASIKTEK